MSSKQLHATKKKHRHRIREIALDPVTSDYDIGIEVLVDGNRAHKLNRVVKHQKLRWDTHLPCDAHDLSTVAIRITEIHTIRNQIESHTYIASQVHGKARLMLDRGNGKYSVRLELMSKKEERPMCPQAEDAYYVAMTKAKEIEEQSSILEKLGTAGVVFKGILDLGSAIAEASGIFNLN
ncbi:ATP-dependent DNA helicase/nuclease subunit A [Ceratobasidium sp. AG-Ba]|nr:ATP-dependent DNA helicase/nuclease subunit A [Ceratobasidium sp. AG-Ba]